jgi:hypothetical protein
VRFVVVDSFSGAARRNGRSGESPAAVRWLAALARDTGKSILLLHHLRKRALLGGARRVSLDRLRGHSSIVQPARIVLALDAPDPIGEDLRRLSVIKSNLAAPPEPLGLWVTESGELQFGPVPEPPVKTTALEQAMHALRDRLQSGPLPVEQVIDDLQEQGFSPRTIRRAKVQLGVCSDKERDRWVWALPLDKLELARRDH